MGFITRSLLVITALYALVFAVADLYFMHGQAPVWWGVAFVITLITVQYLVSPWLIEFFYTISFYEDEIPATQRAFVEELCHRRGLPPIKLGLIESGTPNAFAYGRLRADARIVMTRGLLDLLTQDEIDAVLAHEVGHVAHYDFAVMAAASIAPLLLYQLYAWTRHFNIARVVSYVAYMAYWVGQYIVLLLNRTREYAADHFSATVIGQPSHLSSALVKIGYGMVYQHGENLRVAKHGSSQEKKDANRAQQLGTSLGLLGIASAHGADAMALAATPEAAARVMQWDLTNPWARFYELNSTHPLTAFRIRALNRASPHIEDIPYPLPEDTRVRWARFPVELLFWIAPLACGFLLFTWGWIGKDLRKDFGFVPPPHLVPTLLTILGITWAFRIAFRYQGAFRKQQVETLLEDMDVSQMRPRAVELTGEIIGNGVPGAFWSPDLVFKDSTGLMFLLYRSSVPFGRLFFAVRSAERFLGEQVTVRGWYRRGIKPYVELSSIESTVSKARPGRGLTTLFAPKEMNEQVEYERLIERSYSHWIQYAVAAACTAAGLAWLLN